MAIRRPIRIRVAAKTRSKSDLFGRVSRVLTSVAQRPLALVLLLLATALFVSYEADKTTNLLTKFTAKIGTDTAVSKFILNNKVQSIAFIGYTGAVVGSAPTQQIPTYVLASAVLAFFIPEANHFEYFVQGVLLTLFIALRRPIDKILVGVAACICYSAGYAFSFLKK